MFFCFVLFWGWLFVSVFYVFSFLPSSPPHPPSLLLLSLRFLFFPVFFSSFSRLVCLSSMANLGWMFLQDGLVLISSRVSRSPTRVVESHADYLDLSHCGALSSGLGMCWRIADEMVGFFVARLSLCWFAVWRTFLGARCC